MIAQERLYLTEKRDRVVREGDARSAFLYAVPGDEIPQSAVDRFGLVDGRLPDKSAGKPKAARDDQALSPNPVKVTVSRPAGNVAKGNPKADAKEKAPAEDKEKSGVSKEGATAPPSGDQGGGQAPDASAAGGQSNE